uniref:TBP-like factor n=1 Tax=Rhabditophanes sp. KR3021 TaxID=114890 RepID=A0AC35TU79_9BILA
MSNERVSKISHTGKIPLILPDNSKIDVNIHNVIINYQIPMHIDLRKVALETSDVEYERSKGHLMRRKRNPNCVVKIFNSGKVLVLGCKSEEAARKASRGVARMLQKIMGKEDKIIRMRNYNVNNILAAFKFPFGIKIEEIAKHYPANGHYEPEMFVGLDWKFDASGPSGTLRVHTTGTVTIAGAKSEEDVMECARKIYQIVRDYKCMDRYRPNDDADDDSVAAKETLKRKARNNGMSNIVPKRPRTYDAPTNPLSYSDEEDLYDI